MIKKAQRPILTIKTSDLSSTSTLVGTPPRPTPRRQTTPERMAEREQWVNNQLDRVGNMIGRAYTKITAGLMALLRGLK